MKRILLDTNGYAAFKKNDPIAIGVIRSVEYIKGKPIPSNDMWVAASAMRHGVALFTLDEHFDSVDGLIIKNSDL